MTYGTNHLLIGVCVCVCGGGGGGGVRRRVKKNIAV